MKPGSPCPCGHYLCVVNTKIEGGKRTQYFGCRKCGYRPEDNKRILDIDEPTPRFVRESATST